MIGILSFRERIAELLAWARKKSINVAHSNRSSSVICLPELAYIIWGGGGGGRACVSQIVMLLFM